MEDLNWTNCKDSDVRRKNAFDKTPGNWRFDKRILYTALCLDYVSKKSKKKEDKRAAKSDSEYYYNQLKELKNIGK